MENIKNGYVHISIDRLTPADWNYKKDNPDLLDKLKNNIKRNGMIENLIIRDLKNGFFEVVNGNHRLQALKDLNWKKPIMVFNMGNISTPHAQRIAIETNETKFDKDNVELSKILKELSIEFDIDDISTSRRFTTSAGYNRLSDW